MTGLNIQTTDARNLSASELVALYDQALLSIASYATFEHDLPENSLGNVHVMNREMPVKVSTTGRARSQHRS